MSKTICIKGNFSPLTKSEKQSIQQIVRKYKNAHFVLEGKDDRFYEILKKEFPFIEKTNIIDEVITIEEKHGFSFDEFYKYTASSKEFIYENEELLKKLVKPMVSERRFHHTLSVAEVSRALAKVHGIDQKKAFLAGIFHDLLKNYSEEEMDAYLKVYDAKRLSEPTPIKHAYACKYYLKEHLNYYDYDVLQAIYHHADGKYNSRLAKILYIADKRDPLRKIDDNILEIAFIDLNKAFNLLKIDVENYIRKHKNV